MLKVLKQNYKRIPKNGAVLEYRKDSQTIQIGHYQLWLFRLNQFKSIQTQKY